MRTPESNKEWIAWGERDPPWGVASAPGKERGNSAPWTDAEFYALGAQDFADYRAFWNSYGLTTDSCVEIGCGAGRMTKQLAQLFGFVHAIDISPAMLDYAKEHVPDKNITWHAGSGTQLPIPDQSVTAAFSCHVFQHFSAESVAYAYFKEIGRVLKPGGTLLIHLPLIRYHRNEKLRKMSRVLYKIYFMIYQLYGRAARWRMERGGKLHIHGLSYEERSLAAELSALSSKDISFACKWDESDPLTVALARK
ncbi:MAG TPA: class I SAM-dependent methyltransferase [Acidobacteriaceae bacterium]|nr:class I SAM-dependent methyltransferase [Acidobacteriaceae bacterium]